MVTVSPETASLITRSLERLRAYIESEDFKGYDPYDALNSPLLRVLTLGRKYPRIAATQALKRCPVNLRPLLLMKKGHNPKGLGLFLWGYAKLYHIHQDPGYLARIDQLLDLLTDLRSANCNGNAWGYNFDWQSRAFFVPKFTPTIVNSSFIGHALLDTYRYTGKQRALDLALSIKEFLLKDLHRTCDEDASFAFSYTPIDKLAVHNANLLGASLLIRLYDHVEEERVRDDALAALRYSMKRQRPDGSWWYADTDYQQWIDSFHTGFNLQSIQYFLDSGHADEYTNAFKCGVDFYARNFFLDNGTAKYFHDRIYPIDIHSYAQAVAFFSRMGDTFRSLLDRITNRMVETFQSCYGSFYFQQKPTCTIRIPYMRWAQSWAFHALTDYLLFSSDHSNRSEATSC